MRPISSWKLRRSWKTGPRLPPAGVSYGIPDWSLNEVDPTGMAGQERAFEREQMNVCDRRLTSCRARLNLKHSTIGKETTVPP